MRPRCGWARASAFPKSSEAFLHLDSEALDEHLAAVAALLERYGVSIDLGPDEDLAIDELPSAALGFALRGFLSDDHQPSRSVVELRETWRPLGTGRFERSGYEYELLDHDHNVRRGWHLHDPDYFARHFQVVVHEHCERPIGSAACQHYAGLPVRDAFAGVELLIGTWVDPEPPECAALVCLEAG